MTYNISQDERGTAFIRDWSQGLVFRQWGLERATAEQVQQSSLPDIGVSLDIQVVEVVGVFHLAGFGALQPLNDLSFHLHGYVRRQQGQQKSLLKHGVKEKPKDVRPRSHLKSSLMCSGATLRTLPNKGKYRFWKYILKKKSNFLRSECICVLFIIYWVLSMCSSVWRIKEGTAISSRTLFIFFDFKVVKQK